MKTLCATLIGGLMLFGCSGSAKKPSGTEGVGESSIDPTVTNETVQADAGAPAIPDAGPPPAPVTFVLKNMGQTELALNMDRGYGSVFQIFSGKPPKAKAILAFPKHCTTSCETAPEEKCPTCTEPEKVKDQMAAQKLEKIAPGAELEVPWDGMMLAYEKTRNAKKKRCECFTPTEVPPETYTVRACGLRLTTAAGTNSQLVCAEGKLIWPAEEAAVRVELQFVK